MSTTSPIGSVLDGLRAAFALRPGLAGVNLFTGAVGLEAAGLECVVLGDDCDLSEIAATMGGGRDETWNVSGQLRIVRPWADSIEATFKAARDRALAVLAEIEIEINDSYTGHLPDVELAKANLNTMPAADGAECRVTFTLAVLATKNP